MKTILFQGDSITDAGRPRDNDVNFGQGYPTLVSASLGYDYPNQYKFLNRAVSGDRSVDVYARIKSDIINLKPDYMSLLFGVNDVWHEIARQNGVSAEKYEMVYDLLIKEVLAALPNIKIMILEPYVCHGTATDSVWETFRGEVELRAKAAKRIAEKYNLNFVPLQSVFDKLAETTPEPYWTNEGVHPSPFGHELIAREWLKAFEKIK